MGISPYCETGKSVVKMGNLWYIKVSASLTEHLWFLSLERSSVLGIRRLEIDIGGLEVGRMSEYRSRKAGSAEILHFFRSFPIFLGSRRGCFSHCKAAKTGLMAN